MSSIGIETPGSSAPVGTLPASVRERAFPSDATDTRAYRAYRILHIGFVVLPILAGIDKFLNMLVDWSAYLAPAVIGGLPFSPGAFMQIVGGIEIAAGLLVAIAPHIGAYVVAAWLWGIIVNLFLVPGYYDIALRDFGLSLGALALAQLAAAFRGPREDR
jgi:hypothetical protein